MKRLVWLCLFLLFAVPALTQHRGGFGGGLGRGGAVSGRFGHGRFRGGIRGRSFGLRPRVFPTSDFFPYAFPLFAGDYGYGYAPEPNIVVLQQPAPQVIVQQAPPAVVRSEIHDYSEPTPATSPATKREETAFLIALNDSSIHEASAVWVQDSVLHYVDREDGHHQIPLKSVDRTTTRKLNRERKLNFWLPGAQ